MTTPDRFPSITDEQREQLSAYIDGALPESERLMLEAELERSIAMKRELDSLVAARDLLRSLPELRPPRDLRLTPDMVRPQTARVIRFPTAAALSAAAALILITVGILSLIPPSAVENFQEISALSTAASPSPETSSVSPESAGVLSMPAPIDSGAATAIPEIGPVEADDKTASPELIETPIEQASGFSSGAAQPDTAASALSASDSGPSVGAAQSRSAATDAPPLAEDISAAQPAAIMPPAASIQAFSTHDGASLPPTLTDTPKPEPTLTQQPAPTATVQLTQELARTEQAEPLAERMTSDEAVEARETAFPAISAVLIALGLALAGLTAIILIRSRS